MTNQVCPDCDGKGYRLMPRMHDISDNPGGKEVEHMPCETCGGSGWLSGGSR
jgi:DnaJ-class molecular chaperone